MNIAARRLQLFGALAVVMVVGFGGIVPAAAHGDPEFSGEVGPFAVEAFDEQIFDTDLLYTVVVNDPTTGLPVRGATVEVSAESATRRIGPLVGNELGGAYQVLLPDPGDEAWQITVRIVVADDAVTFVVADDAVTFSHELAPGVVEGRGSWRNALLAIAAVVAVLAAFALTRTTHRTARAARPQGS